MKLYRAAAVLAAIFVACGAGTANTIDIISSRDNTLIQDAAGTLSDGAGTHMFVGNTAMGSIRRALVGFDLSALPAGSTINDVTLRLNMSKSNSSQTVELHRVLANWGEGTSNGDGSGGGGGGAPSTPGDATWIHTFYDTSFWTNPGGDFSSTVSASQPVDHGPDLYLWSATPDMIADVQGWVNDSSTNFGWILIGDEVDSQTAMRFDTHENLTVLNRPTLSIDYTPPAMVPAAPSDLSATAASDTEIDLTWTDNGGGETGFSIERSDDGMGDYSEVATVGAGVTSYSDAGLTASTLYQYRVRAFNGAGYSDYSSEADATTNDPS